MRKLAVLPLAALLLAACSESPTTPAAARPQFSEGNAFFTLATPGAPVASASGADAITVQWSALFSELQTECDAQAAANLGNSETSCRGVHFELYRNGVHIADVAGESYVDAGLAPGSYVYQIKAKGIEQASREESFTYHSLLSDPSNEVIVSLLACGTPTITAAITAGSSSYPRLNNAVAQVTFGGSTTNWAGCTWGGRGIPHRGARDQ